jgi:polar amino acid transport system permease protein
MPSAGWRFRIEAGLMDLSRFFTDLYIARWPLLEGVGMTLSISFTAIILGTVLGIGVALSLVYGGKAQRFAVRAVLEYVRGTPVFVLILACYYLLSQAGIQLTPFQAGLVALTVFCSSHVGENLRGALLALPKGQTEAAKAIGLTFPQTFVYVLAPQALRQALPAWINTAAELVKASTLLAVIGVVEVMLTTRQIIAIKPRPLEFYFVAGVIYFLICFSIERLGRRIERRIALPS